MRTTFCTLKRATNSPGAYRAINPQMVVPTLIEGYEVQPQPRRWQLSR